MRRLATTSHPRATDADPCAHASRDTGAARTEDRQLRPDRDEPLEDGRRGSQISPGLAELIGTIDPPLYPPYAFDQASQALQDLADRETHGKVVVTF